MGSVPLTGGGKEGLIPSIGVDRRPGPFGLSASRRPGPDGLSASNGWG